MKQAVVTMVGAAMLALVSGEVSASEHLDPPFGAQQAGRFDGSGGTPVSYRYALRARPREHIPFVMVVSKEGPGAPGASAMSVHVVRRNAQGTVRRASSQVCSAGCAFEFDAPETKEAPVGGEYTLYVRDESPPRSRASFHWLVKRAR